MFPKELAKLHQEKALGLFVLSVISVRNDLIIPKFPDKKPEKARPIIAWVYVCVIKKRN